MYGDLRVESAKVINSMDFPGNAIGGSFRRGAKRRDVRHARHAPCLIFRKTSRDIKGVGTLDCLLEGVERGVDMFDCVIQTRIARNRNGFYEIRKIRYKKQRLCERFFAH